MTTQSTSDRIRARMSELIAQGVDPMVAIQQATQEANPTPGQPGAPGAPPGGPASPFPTGPTAPSFGPGDFSAPGIDSFTGGVDPGAQDEFLRQQQGTVGGRRGLFEDLLQSQQGYYDTSAPVREFAQNRFYPLEAQYAAQSALDSETPDFLSFLQGGDRASLGGQDWQNVLGQLGQQFGGIGSEQDVSSARPCSAGAVRRAEAGRSKHPWASHSGIH